MALVEAFKRRVVRIREREGVIQISDKSTPSPYLTAPFSCLFPARYMTSRLNVCLN